MKKIFLTSGIVVCMACPAFATSGQDIGTDAEIRASSGQAEAADCVEDVLETSTAGKYVKFNALWRPDKINIALDSTVKFKNCTSNDVQIHADVTNPDPTGLFVNYDVAVYGSEANRNADRKTSPSDATDAFYGQSGAYQGTNSITALTSSPVRTGYTFQGYYTGQTSVLSGGNDVSSTAGLVGVGGNKVIESNKSFTTANNEIALLTEFPGTGDDSAQNVTIYASWQPKQYQITYNCGNYGSQRSGAGLVQNVVYDQCFAFDGYVTDPNIEDHDRGTTRCEAQNGYKFGGWSCTNLSSAEIAAAGGHAWPTSDATIPDDYNLSKYATGEVDTAYTLFAAGTAGVWTHDGNIVCTAKWIANIINLRWFADGTEQNYGTERETCIYGEAINMPPTNPTKTGYTFAGWDVISVDDTNN